MTAIKKNRRGNGWGTLILVFAILAAFSIFIIYEVAAHFVLVLTILLIAGICIFIMWLLYKFLTQPDDIIVTTSEDFDEDDQII